MSKNEGKGLKSFNKGFQVPDTYIIIFLVVVIAALLTFLVPKGFYETQDISYMINGVEKTRTVIKDGSFQYLTDDAGNVVTEGVALFSGDGGTGFFNYMYNGIVNSSAIEIIAFLMVVGGAFGIMIRTGAIESGLIGLIRKAKGAEKLLIPILFVLFSLCGAVFGMGEEALPFTMILCPLFVAVGYDSVIAVLVDKALNGRVRCAAASHRAAVDRALHFGIIVELAARVLELDRHGVHVLIKAIERCLPIAAERVRTQLDCVGILDDRLLHRDLKVVLLLIVAAVAVIYAIVLWGLLYPGELKADRAVRIVYHIALRKQKAARQQQNDHQHHGQHASAAPAPAITGIALRSARSSCHCLHPPPFSCATVYLLRAKKSTKT